MNQVRYTNQMVISEYLDGNTEGTMEPLTDREIREEYFFLGLRKTEGVFPGRYQEYYASLFQKLQQQQLLEEAEGRVRLTDRGIDVSNYVLAQFLE